MKPIAATEAQADLDSVLDLAQKERLVILRNGKPSAVVVGVENYDAEDWALATSADFWRMIEERRDGRLLSLADVKARLASARPGEVKRPGKAPPKAARKPNNGRTGTRRPKVNDK
jgi:prevent-host-death family protein